MKPNYKILGTTAALAILVLGFQNCSPVKFGANEQLAGKSGVVAPPVDDGVADIDDRDPQPIKDGPAEDNNTDPDYDYSDNNTNNPDAPPKSGDEYRAKCAEAGDNRFLSMPAGAQISGHTQGVQRYKAPSMKSISGHHNEVVVLRDGGSGKLGHISGHIDKLIVCGFYLDSLSGHDGEVILVNSHVEDLSGHKTKIKAIDSTFGKQSGHIVELIVETLK